MGNDLRTLVLERPRGSIARVGKERFFLSLAFCIQGFKTLPRHQHFATYFKLFRIIGALGQLQGYGANRADIGRHVVATHTIASRHAAHQFTLLVGERDAEAVKLEFAANVKGRATQSFAHSAIEIAHLCAVVGIAQRQHGIFVRNLLKLVLLVASYAHRWRIGVCHFWMLCFEFLKLVHQHIKIVVGNLGAILHVV